MAEEMFPIDKYSLDDEWAGQPELFRVYAQSAADWQTEVDTKKDDLEVLRAELDARYREEMDAAGKKVTEAVISSLIVRTEDFQKAQKELRVSQNKLMSVKATVTALDQRKAALENLVRLYGQEYFSKPTVSDREREMYTTTKVTRTTRDKLNKKKES